MFPEIGWGELLVVILVVLLLFGPKRLPEIGKALGRSIGSFKEGLKEGEDSLKGKESEETAKASGQKDDSTKSLPPHP